MRRHRMPRKFVNRRVCGDGNESASLASLGSEEVSQPNETVEKGLLATVTKA